MKFKLLILLIIAAIFSPLLQADEALLRINRYRAMVGMSPFVTNQELTQAAQNHG